MTEMVPTVIAEQWTLLLPRHRAERAEPWGSWWPTWERPRLESMRRNLHPGDLVFDIGAEEGDFPALWASWGCDVVLVEPNPRVWPNIRAIWEANELPDPRGWVGFCGAANDWDRPGWAAQVEPRDGWPECAYGPVIGDHGFLNLWERPDVPVITIDTLASIHGAPDVITIDVEGAEFEVLKGATGILETARPLLYVSVHPAFMFDSYQHTVDELVGWLAEHGYRREHLGAGHEWHELFYPSERAADVVLPYADSRR